MTELELTKKVQDGVLKAVETSQKWTLGALRTTVSAFDGIQPKTSLVPFADQLPSPGVAIESTFAFAGRLLDAQHSFFSGLAGLAAAPAGTAKKV
jgi:hypothetical protein